MGLRCETVRRTVGRMSADNWAVCPRCLTRREAALEKSRRDITAAYGKVPVEEFDRMRADYETAAGTEPERTLREDYEIWTDPDGVFTVTYSSGCRECGFGFEFRHEEQKVVGS